MNPISRLHEPLWPNCIRRDPDQVRSGRPAQMAGEGESRDVTSNPTIFEQVIFEIDLYAACMRPLAAGPEACE